MSNLSVEATGLSDTGHCECCGNRSRTVWGYVYQDANVISVYYVHWTRDRIDHGATVELLVGPWGAGASPNDRSAVRLAYQISANGPEFMVIDAHDSPAAQSELVNGGMRREEVIGTDLEPLVFKIVDAVWLQDSRIVELHS